MGEVFGSEAELQVLRVEVHHVVGQQLATALQGVVLDEVKVEALAPGFNNELVEGGGENLAIHTNDVLEWLRVGLATNGESGFAIGPSDGPVGLGLRCELSALFLALGSFSGFGAGLLGGLANVDGDVVDDLRGRVVTFARDAHLQNLAVVDVGVVGEKGEGTSLLVEFGDHIHVWLMTGLGEATRHTARFVGVSNLGRVSPLGFTQEVHELRC